MRHDDRASPAKARHNQVAPGRIDSRCSERRTRLAMSSNPTPTKMADRAASDGLLIRELLGHNTDW